MSHLLNHFLSHRRVTNNLVSKIEESNYSYKPTETSMSAEKLVSHIYTSFYKFIKSVKVGNGSPFMEKLENPELNLSQLGEHYTEMSTELLQSLTEDELNSEIDMTKIFGMTLTGHQMVQMAMDHEIHHKGNLFVYVREMGHTELPLFLSVK